jgi:NitT/TauT family transport system permease protein
MPQTRRMPGPTADRGLRVAVEILSPPSAVLAVWAFHQFLPDRQLLPLGKLDYLPAWQHPYPVLLGILLVIALVQVVAYWVLAPLRPRIRHHAPLLTGAILMLGIWDLVTVKLNWLKLPNYPGPDTVFWGMVDDWDILLKSTWHSLQLLVAGYSIGVTMGLVTGVTIGWFSRARYWGMPIVKLIGPMPATALVALVMTLSTHSFICGALLIGLAVWFPMTMLTASGIANVRLSYLDVARTLGAGRLYLIFRVAIPAALPNIFIGLFMGLGASFLTLVVAETVGVPAGLGWYLKWRQGTAMEYDKVYGALIIMAVFFSGMMTLLFKFRDWMLAWQKGVIRW